MTIIAFNRQWIFRWHWVLINLLAVLILLSLSAWQWQRAVQKRSNLNQLAHWQSRPALSPMQLQDLQQQEKPDASDGASVAFAAEWVEPFMWLMDNQIINARAGYDVIIPVRDSAAGADAPLMLVNLGWIAGPLSRTELPRVHLSKNLVVQGIYRARPHTVLLGKNIEDLGHWPMRVQKIDTAAFAQYLPQSLMPGVVYQQIESPFLIHYRPVVLPPERHQAYALQWLLLALGALLVGIACAQGASSERAPSPALRGQTK